MDITQGHGIEGRYLGLQDPYGSEEFAKVVILPIPFDKTTTYQKGSDKGPEALIEASRNLELYDIDTDSEVYLKGIYTDTAIHSENSEEMIFQVQKRVKELIERKKFVVSIGGEHSISYPVIKAHAEHYKRLTVLQLDAHADLQPAYENNPWSHASVMARVSEISEDVKIISVGIRSLSPVELQFIDKKKTLFSHQLENDWIQKVLELLDSPVYITFDLDVFDCSLMPSTGTPEPGGIDWKQAINLLKAVITERVVVGFDLVELCPNPFNSAPDYLAAKLIYKMLSYKFKG